MDYLSMLNDKQREAAEFIDGPLLILAGAGSGKTRTVISRIVHILKSRQVMPGEILALTFTNKAAGEMRDRINSYNVAGANQIWMGTFHSICARFLRMHASAIGYDSHFTIYDDADSKKIVTALMKELNMPEKSVTADSVRSLISKAKENYILPQDYMSEFGEGFLAEKIAMLYEMYNQQLKANNAMDFDDLLLNTLILFDAAPEVEAYYQNRFKYVLVDEYQDTNRLQYEIVSRIAGYYKNLCVCGDDDQSIYGWRGADIRNILEFEQDFPNAKVVRLEQNYRSTGNILRAANSVIANNYSRMGKALWTASDAGEKITLCALDQDLEEGEMISREIKQLRQETGTLNGIAMLYRVNAQSRLLEEALVRAGIAYKIYGGTRFYDRMEVKDVLSYLRFVSNGADRISFERAVASPKRGLGDSAFSKLYDYCDFKQITIREALEQVYSIPSVSVSQKAKFTSFVEVVREIERLSTVSLRQAMEAAVNKSGYMDHVVLLSDDSKDSRIENLKELIKAAGDFEQTSEDASLEAFLENVALVSGADLIDEKDGSVLLMTMHNSKGLEFDTVFLPGFEEGYFPLTKATLNISELEEERRLCYVAITRARKKLYISYCGVRRVYGSTMYRMPSRFIKELPTQVLEMKNVKKGYESKEEWFERTPAKKSFDANFGFASPYPDYTGAALKKEKPAPALSSPSESFAPGDKIIHATWGNGVVVSVSQMDSDTLITAAFAGLGIKKFFSSFAKKE